MGHVQINITRIKGIGLGLYMRNNKFTFAFHFLYNVTFISLI